MKVDLPDGGWAEIQLPKVLRKRDVVDILEDAEKAGVDVAGGQLSIRQQTMLQDVLLARYVVDWSLTDGGGQRLPVTLDTLGDLPMATWSALGREVGPALQQITGAEVEPGPLSAAG